jgi:chloride channel 3/4/5
MNSYPFLDNKIRPIFTSELRDITPRVRSERVIDISHSPLVSATKLRRKLQNLHDGGELDGGLPILRDGALVGLIPAPDLEFALDKLEDENDTFCLMAAATGTHPHDGDEVVEEFDPTDFTSYVDPVRAPPCVSDMYVNACWFRLQLH